MPIGRTVSDRFSTAFVAFSLALFSLLAVGCGEQAPRSELPAAPSPQSTAIVPMNVVPTETAIPGDVVVDTLVADAPQILDAGLSERVGNVPLSTRAVVSDARLARLAAFGPSEGLDHRGGEQGGREGDDARRKALVAAPGEAAASPVVAGSAAAREATAPSSRGGSPRSVGLQAGHWRYWEMQPPLGARGTAGGGKTEPEVNLDIAQRAAVILRRQGFVVDILPANLPKGYKADVVVAIHADGSSLADRRGFFADRWARLPASSSSERLRLDLIDAYGAATGLSYVCRGTPNSKEYYGYYRVASGTPMALLEGGFLTNALDRQILVAQPDRAAQGIADSIMRFLGR